MMSHLADVEKAQQFQSLNKKKQKSPPANIMHIQKVFFSLKIGWFWA